MISKSIAVTGNMKKRLGIVERRCQDLRGEFPHLNSEDVLLHPYLQIISDPNLGPPTPSVGKIFNSGFLFLVSIYTSTAQRLTCWECEARD